MEPEEITMGRILGTVFGLMCLSLAADAGETASREAPARQVFFDARRHRTEYAGPGRETPPPADLGEVRIGYFGPCDPAHAEGGDMWQAAGLAIKEANAQGGLQGKPFRLVSGWSENPWGTGVSQVVRMAYQERVWAIVGGIDGPSTHLAEQVVAKARLTLLSPASTDKTVNLANVPWMFSCLPGDHLQAPLLAAEIAARTAGKPWVLVSAVDHDSRLFAMELKKALAVHRMVPRYQFECNQPARDVAGLAMRIVQSKPGAAVIVAGAGDSARLVAAVRQKGFTGEVFGGPSMGRHRFLREGGAAVEGVIFPLLYHPGEAAGEFEKTFKGRFGISPDYAAAHTYDAVRLLVAAVRKAGLNRARIRDAVRKLSPWTGVTGTAQWDPLGSNARNVRLGTIRDGRPVPLPAGNATPIACDTP